MEKTFKLWVRFPIILLARTFSNFGCLPLIVCSIKLEKSFSKSFGPLFDGLFLTRFVKVKGKNNFRNQENIKFEKWRGEKFDEW